jgi:hypothetical protein
MDSIRKTVQTCMEILDFVIPSVVSAIDAPAEVIDIRTRLEALSHQLISERSILGGILYYRHLDPNNLLASVGFCRGLTVTSG